MLTKVHKRRKFTQTKIKNKNKRSKNQIEKEREEYMEDIFFPFTDI